MGIKFVSFFSIYVLMLQIKKFYGHFTILTFDIAHTLESQYVYPERPSK